MASLGPSNVWEASLLLLHGPMQWHRNCSCRWLHDGPLHLLLPLPIYSIGPTVGTADALGWAHYISGCPCQSLPLVPLFYCEVLLMPHGGPIPFVAAAAVLFAWARGGCYRFFRVGLFICSFLCWQFRLGPSSLQLGTCRSSRMGPLYLQLQLSIASTGPNCFLEVFAHCVCCLCCRFICLGPW